MPKAFYVQGLQRLFLNPEMGLGAGTNECVIVSGSLDQARIIFTFIKEALAGKEKEYRFLDSSQRLWIENRATGYRVRAISSSAKHAMGLGSFSLLIGDEPGAWEAREGRLMYDALRQSLGKRPDQKVLLIGTLAPSEPGSWWPELIKSGTNKQTGVFVTNISADIEEPWDEWETVKSC